MSMRMILASKAGVCVASIAFTTLGCSDSKDAEPSNSGGSTAGAAAVGGGQSALGGASSGALTGKATQPPVSGGTRFASSTTAWSMPPTGGTTFGTTTGREGLPTAGGATFGTRTVRTTPPTSGGTTASGGRTGAGGKSGAAGGVSVGGSAVGSPGSSTTAGASGTGTAGTIAPTLPAISGTCPTFTTGTATIGGLSGISLQVGAKKDGTGSLLFYWHGTGSSASEVTTMMPSAVRQDILAQGGIIVSFQGSTGTGGDCSGTGTFSKDDFKIADLIAACAVKDHGIDPRRIYTTGCSAGGLQAGCMGAMRSSYIAASVPNSGGETTKQPIQDTAHIPSIMTMHGGSSDRVVVSFSTTSATLDAQMKSAGGFVVNCNHGGGHCQAPATLYSAAWAFMQDHPFGVKPEPYAADLPGTFPSYCAIY